MIKWKLREQAMPTLATRKPCREPGAPHVKPKCLGRRCYRQNCHYSIEREFQPHKFVAAPLIIDARRPVRVAHPVAAIEERAARVSIVNLVEKIAAVVAQPKRRR